jgi:hypothetical protein
MIRAAAAVLALAGLPWGWLALAGLPWGWLALASFIFLQITGQSDKFSFPYVQWALVAPYWRVNWWVTLCVMVAAIGATLPLALLIAAVVWWCRRSARSAPTLYGKSAFATPADMRSNAISLQEKPF